MQTTKNDLLIQKNASRYQEDGYTRTQSLQLAYCDIWDMRTDVHMKRFLCSCSDCPDKKSGSINDVREYVLKHKGHRTKVTARAV